MKSFTLLLQVVGLALVTPSGAAPVAAAPQGGWKGVAPQRQVFLAADNDYLLTPSTTAKPLRIVVADQPAIQETREQYLARKKLQDEELRRQAESAKYSFASSLSDRIMDGEHIREETRQGLKTTGMYSYSDGYVRRTVEYVADENGYRVTKQTEEPIGNGPQYDPTGSADVATYYDRSKLQYSITTDDIQGHLTPEDEEDEDEDTTTKKPFPLFQRASVPVTPTVQVSNDFDTEQLLRPAERHDIQTPVRPAPAFRSEVLSQRTAAPVPTVQTPTGFSQQVFRPAERHDIQIPVRPSPTLRGEYFTQVHSLSN